eukprot:SAG25_NODE_2259_length_1777_cov_1.220501_1_plen_59_part_10
MERSHQHQSWNQNFLRSEEIWRVRGALGAAAKTPVASEKGHQMLVTQHHRSSVPRRNTV